jgi:hypothetical protein
MPTTLAEASTVDREFKAAKDQLQQALGTSFVAMGEALLKMQAVARKCDKTKAGREKWLDLSGCKTFEEFVRLEFQMAARTSRQYMTSVKVYRRLEKAAPGRRNLPIGEKQCRWLAKVQPPKRLPKVWAEILKQYARHLAERPADAKKVSPHPPATFIYKHLVKAGFMAGEDGGVYRHRDSRKVAKATRRLSGAMEAIEWFKLEEEEEYIDQLAEREKWNANDRKQLGNQLDELIEWATRLRERI